MTAKSKTHILDTPTSTTLVSTTVVDTSLDRVTLESVYDQETIDAINESEDLVRDSKRSILNSRRHVHEIKTTLAPATLEKLYHQGKKLESIDIAVDGINEDLKEGERQLRSIESITGALRNKFIGRKKPKKLKPTKAVKVVDVKVRSPTPIPKSTYNPSMFNHLSTEAQTDLQEIEDHTNGLFNDLSEIQKMAQDMGTEIKRHNEMLGRLSPKVQVTTDRVKYSSSRTQKQI